MFTVQELAFYIFGVFIAISLTIRLSHNINSSSFKTRLLGAAAIIVNLGSAAILLATILRAGGYPLQ